MKKRLVPFMFLVASMLVFGCAEEVVPTQIEPVETTVEIPDTVESTDPDEEEGVDPNV